MAIDRVELSPDIESPRPDLSSIDIDLLEQFRAEIREVLEEYGFTKNHRECTRRTDIIFSKQEYREIVSTFMDPTMYQDEKMRRG